MGAKNYKIHDGQLSVNVNDNDATNTIRIEFESGDDTAKHALALNHGTQIADIIRANEPALFDTLNADGNNFTLNATFEDPTKYFAVLGATHEYLEAHIVSPEKNAAAAAANQEEKPSEIITLDDSEFTSSPPKSTPPIFGPLPRHGKPMVPPPGEPAPELSVTQSYLKRIKTAQRDAAAKSTLKTHALNELEGGLSATVFPMPLAIVTGKESDAVREGDVKDTTQIVIRINAGSEPDARAEVVRMTNEVEKLLRTRNLSPARSEIYHASSGDERKDTGVIVVSGADNTAETLAKINDVIDHVRENSQVLRGKLGRGRGEDFRQRKEAAPEIKLTPGGEALLEALKEAANDGAITLNVGGDLLRQWAAWLAHKAQSAEKDLGAGR